MENKFNLLKFTHKLDEAIENMSVEKNKCNDEISQHEDAISVVTILLDEIKNKIETLEWVKLQLPCDNVENLIPNTNKNTPNDEITRTISLEEYLGEDKDTKNIRTSPSLEDNNDESTQKPKGALTINEKSQIEEMWDTGGAFTEICEKVNRTKRAVRQYLMSIGIENEDIKKSDK